MRSALVAAWGFAWMPLLLAAAPATAQEDQGDSPSPPEESSSPGETSVELDVAGEAAQEAPAGSPPGAATGAADAQELKLRGLEERVNEMKEKIFRTKARILQLQETVVSGTIGAGARAVLLHRNEMGGAFKLSSVQYALDGQPIFKKVDVQGDLTDIEEKEIFSGNIVPGNHTITVQMVFQGQGYGFFSYVKGYRFKVNSSYTFSAEEGKIITVKVVGFERGGITTPLEERPSVRYDIRIEKLTPDSAKTLQEKAKESG